MIYGVSEGGGGRNIKVKKKKKWQNIEKASRLQQRLEMVKNMADFCIVFHFYATSLSLSPSGKAEEGKQSRAASVGFILLNMSHEWCESDKRIKKLFLGLFDKWEKAEFGKHWHVVPIALLMSLEPAFDLEGGSVIYPCDDIKIITPWI